ncbi:hypothetical protein IWZ01DRAFT_516305 [Phyllosticta capitalensis]
MSRKRLSARRHLLAKKSFASQSCGSSSRWPSSTPPAPQPKFPPISSTSDSPKKPGTPSSRKTPSIKRETFAIPLQQRRLPATTSGDRETQWRELVPLADLYDWNAPRYIQASDLDFNPILSNLTLRFKTNVATPTATQVNDTVKVKLGNDAWAQSFYVSYLNQESEPCVDGGVEVDLWKGFGKSTCDQFICQPPVSRMRITFFSDTETFIWGVRKAGGEIVVESGVQVWHVLATLLDALAVDGGKEIHDLYGEAADLVTERV